MARLIDADALKEAMNYNGGCGICFQYVDSADTVPAIPISWLKEKSMSVNDPFSPYMMIMFQWFKENGNEL